MWIDKCRLPNEGQCSIARGSKFGILHSEFRTQLAGSSNRRTAPFEGANAGAIPAPVASFGSAQAPPGGEIVSRLAYTQKSRGQNLPGRPFLNASLHNQQCAGL